jgi:hypothetical protein
VAYFFVHYRPPYLAAAAKAALSWPTFQQVVRGDNFRGFGMRPVRTPRQTLADEQE